MKKTLFFAAVLAAFLGAVAYYVLAVSSGSIVITNPGSAGSTGSSAVWVKLHPSQANLHPALKWRLKKGGVYTPKDSKYTIEQAPLIDAGEYTIELSECDVCRPNGKFKLPLATSKKVKVTGDQSKPTYVTVKLGGG